MLYPSMWKKITVDQSKSWKIDCIDCSVFFWATRYYIYSSIHPTSFLFFYLPIYLYIFTSTYLFINPSIHSSIHPSVCPFIRWSIHPSIYFYSPCISLLHPIHIDILHLLYPGLGRHRQGVEADEGTGEALLEHLCLLLLLLQLLEQVCGGWWIVYEK